MLTSKKDVVDGLCNETVEKIEKAHGHVPVGCGVLIDNENIGRQARSLTSPPKVVF